MADKMWAGYKNFDHAFDFQFEYGWDNFITEVMESLDLVDQPISRKGRVEYLNIPASFDIETYSSYYHGHKFANMYIWQLGINGSTITGRTWNEFTHCLSLIQSAFNLDRRHRLIIFVHNLSYEFQFFRHWVKWEKDINGDDIIFSLKERKPIYALSHYGIEFRCSYMLSNYKLSYIGAKILLKYKIDKKVGDLDYSIPRNSKTWLTNEELGYCISDVQVVMAYIQEEIENYGEIGKLPLTNTGRVREFTRNYVFGSYCSSEEERKIVAANYYDLMSHLQITSTMEYDMLKSAFCGGYTHANAIWVDEILKNLGSGDLASDYPGQCVSDYFPMSSAMFVGQPTEEEFESYLKEFCCLFYVKFYNLVPDFDYDGYISSSRCIELSKDAVINNGRVMSASTVSLIVTELDFEIISKVYDADDYEVHSMYLYKRGYLPRDLILAILELYEKKTSLKGVEGRETEYMVSKNMLNSTYGMMVTDIIRPETIYGADGWETIDGQPIEQLENYNNSYNRFLFYPWGVWVTAHARHTLWEAIFEFGEDYVYSDTDSIKGINFEKHMPFFEEYNRKQRLKLSNMCLYYQIPIAKTMPKTKKGVRKPIGVWEREEDYLLFKTMGAKRYCYVHANGEFNWTVAGVNKSEAVPYILHKYCGVDLELAKLAYSNNPNLEEESKAAMKELVNQNIDYTPAFKAFSVALTIPPEHSGKMTHTYIDDDMSAFITDTQGNRVLCHEKSCVHLEPAGYDFSIAEAFADYLLFGRICIIE